MRVLIHDTPGEVARWAANYIASRINQCVEAENRPFVLGLPTGSTPLETYRELIALYRAGQVSFEKVITFNMDEYIGLSESHPESYHSFMWDNFFSHIDILPENVNILNGNAENTYQECVEYEQKILDAGGIDLFVGGVGADGHIAFNEPFSSMASRTRLKTLTQRTIIDNSRFFDNDIAQVPRTALTVGVGTLMDAREVLILAIGTEKAEALRHGIEGGYNHCWTISALQLHKHGIIVCDEEAIGEVRVNTYRYFKNIEREDPYVNRF